MRRLSRLLALLLGFAAFAVGAEEPVTPAQKLKGLLSQLASIEATFVQATMDAEKRTAQESSGQLWVRNPAQFRIETTAPFVQTLVSDGTSLWTFDADLEQVIVGVLDKDLEQVPVLLLGGAAERIESEYEIAFYASEDLDHFVLVPTNPASLFERLELEFKGGVPFALSISDSIGQHTRIRFSDVQINTESGEGRFTFEPPAGVDVIDDRPGKL